MKHSVLITGSSTGIGRATAVELAQAGHQVFAGVRKASDGEKLRSENSSITPVVIDVAKTETIQSAFVDIGRVRQKDLPFSLVNNAGIAIPGPMEALKLTELRRQFDVNFFGLLETTQMFLPIIRETRGRVINISSVSGRVSSPFLGAYSASKYALEAVSDSMRQELAPFGVKVILIEPGPIQTEIWDKGLANRDVVENYCLKERLELYRTRFERFEKMAHDFVRRAIPVQCVAERIKDAIELKNPAVRVVVAPLQSHLELRLAEWLPASAYDKVVSKALG